ncbi:MAG TPA: Crp/Fnr family transcriptional regulator [Flavisolibacter sp.]|jgi:CRP-like cAMP-binding protein|nr:Crp/Fnr family transcriptional regulator [Flavisolibacter sp.]
MENVRIFFQFLHKFIDLSEEEFNELIKPYLEVRHFKKRALVLNSGVIEDHMNFVSKGLVRKYYKKGIHEISTQIATEGHIIHAQESFYSRTPSEFSLETIEPTTLISVTYDNLEKIYDQNKKMERLGRLVITFSMVIKDRWQINMIKLTPRERFIDFVHKNPELLQRVPQKFLASYLNIQPETFSRFKHLLNSRKKEA